MKRLLKYMLLTAVVFGLLPAGNIHADSEENIHYLGFASDLHDTPDVLEDALNQLPEEPEYFSLIGDMAGGRGNMRPEYSSSEVTGRVTSVLPNLNPGRGNVSIIWADHDQNAVDDAGVFKCVGEPQGYLSEEIYEGKNDDGSTAYYIYGIGFYHMKNGGPDSRDAAEAFKEWVKDKDVTVPVLVLCHVPMKAVRGDNLGASYWNEALNYAATGIEGITSEDADEAEIIRNVIFLSGHNHTVDPKEYIHEAGSAMSIQIDTNLVSGISGKITETEAYDEEIAAEQEEGGNEDEDDPILGAGPPKPNVKAQGITSPIYYTSLTAGYLKTSGNVSLITISDQTITLDKYNGQGETELGVNDAGDPVSGPLEIERIKWGEPEYTWSDDCAEVTAVRSLVNNPSYTEEETVKTTSEITKEPTCTEEGECTCTAVFQNEAFTTQTATEVIEAAGHQPGSPENENYVAASCDRDGSYVEVIKCDVCGEEISRKTIPVGAYGHSWGEWKVTKEPTASEDGERTRTCENNPSHTETEVIPAKGNTTGYRFVSGSGSVWTKGSSSTLNFTVKNDKDDSRTYAKFSYLETDGRKIDSSSYTVSEGSLNIVLKPSYLQSLSAGKHTLRAVFEDGSAEASFTVKTKNKSPDTYDHSDLLLWSLILSFSVITAAGTLYLRRQ